MLDGGHQWPAPVIDNEGHVVETQPLDELGEEAGLPDHREVGVVAHRPAVTTERQRRCDASMITAQAMITSVHTLASITTPWANTITGPSPPVST